MPKLSEKHKEHLELYGSGNDQRLTGLHETSSMESFSYHVRSRGASVRIPVNCEQDKKGYFEDRRPASNIDAYLVSAAMVDTCILDSKYMNELLKAYKLA